MNKKILRVASKMLKGVNTSIDVTKIYRGVSNLLFIAYMRDKITLGEFALACDDLEMLVVQTRARIHHNNRLK